VEHTLYYQHPDKAVQDRGRAFIQQLADRFGIVSVNDTDFFHGRKITVTVNDRLAISYGRAA
jgi:hypothetical protein